MKKIVFILVVLSAVIFCSGVAGAVQVNVKSPANLRCHANEMKKALLHMNRGQNITIKLEVFCQHGAVKYISIGKSGGTAQFVPPNSPVYKICGNPCK